MKKINKEKLKITDITESKKVEDYPDDTVFVFDDIPMERDPDTGKIKHIL